MSMTSQYPELLDPAVLPFPYPRVSLTVRGGEARIETMPPVSAEPRRVLLVHEDGGDGAAAAAASLLAEGLEVAMCTSRDDWASAFERAELVLLFAGASGSSLDICREMRALDPARMRPIVVCGTSDCDEDVVVRSFEHGADDCIPDATRTRELAARVRAQLKNLRDREVLVWARAQRSKLRDLANTDPLTGIANRRAVTRAIQKALVADDPVTVVLVDIDHFKRINDDYGHPAGDAVLRRVARALDAATPAGGMCARWGGEEFAIVVRGDPAGSAERLGERIRQSVSDVTLDVIDAHHVTASVGVAKWDGTGLAPLGLDLIEAADAALYESKRGGRNRVSTSRVMAG
jgi:two-component system cell cycle response regulator